MAMWLYQMSQSIWPPNNYRLDIWENERWKWPVGRIIGSGRSPAAGDIVVFFYAPSRGPEAGFYGWAVILQWLDEGERRDDAQHHFSFRPVSPSDQLKMHPWWDEDARRIVDSVRGTMPQATLWWVPDAEASTIGAGIAAWVAGRSPTLSLASDATLNPDSD